MQRLYRRKDSENWYVNLGGGVYKSTGCRDRRAAEARARLLEQQQHAPPADEGRHAPTLLETLEQAVADRMRRGRAEGTLDMWRKKCGALLRVLGADTPIAQIEARAIDDYQTRRYEEGAADATVAKELGCLFVALEIAGRHGDYPHDLAKVKPVEMHRESKPRTRALSPEEARRLLADLLDDQLEQRRGSMRNRAACVAFILATSARWSEAMRARREDVKVGADGLGFVTLRGTKTEGAARVVPILATTAPLLRIAMEHGRGEGLLFEPWTNVRADVIRASERLGIAPSTPNDWRRTTSEWLKNAGVEPHLIALVMGHKDGRMVERKYGRMSPEALAEALGQRVGGVVPLLPTAPAPARRKAG